MLLKLGPAATWKIITKSQNNNEESNYLVSLCETIDAEKSFIEFGFSVFEFNSVGLARKGFQGIVLDAGEENCDLANKIFHKLKLPVEAIQHWIDLSSLSPITNLAKSLDDKIGVLNVDIDGNDYWILKELLLSIKPEVICVEHNASFGLRTISTPYKADFDRQREHNSGWYHGASITAFYNLLTPDYSLIKNIAGLNLIFVRNDKLVKGLKALSFDDAWSEPMLRNKWSGTTTEQQWESIKHLNFETVK